MAEGSLNIKYREEETLFTIMDGGGREFRRDKICCVTDSMDEEKEQHSK